MNIKITSLVILASLLLCQSSGQTVTSSGRSDLTPSTTEATCGAGGTTCPADESVKQNVTPGIEDVAATVEASTSAFPEEANVSQSGITATESETSSSTQATTPKQQRTTSTTLPTPTSEPATYKLAEEKVPGYIRGGTCACDLTAYFCDVNCCCDPECTPLHRASFSWCKIDGYIPYDNRYCFASKLIFLNNSEHVLQQAQNGAFCIVRSNLAGSMLYHPRPVYSTYQEFEKHWDRSHASSWPQLSPLMSQLTVDKPKPHTAGASIWTIQNSFIQPLGLPSSGISDACSTIKPVQYLLSWSSRCIHNIPHTQNECEKVSSLYFYKLKSIVRSPLLVNQTQLGSETIDSCAPGTCVPVTYFLCESSAFPENYKNECGKVLNTKNIFGYKPGVCLGVFNKLKLLLHHNGTAGIDRAEAYMWLSNMTLMEGKPFYQSISVEFFWSIQNKTLLESANNTDSRAHNSTTKLNLHPFHRSGNPGYIVGKPVVAGFRVKQKSGVNVSQDASKESRTSTKHDSIQLSHNSKEWLTLPGSNIQGICDWSASTRHVVTFGEDLHMSCGVNLYPKNISTVSSCTLLRAKMLQLLLGDVSKSFQNSSMQLDWGRVIAAFGSANVSMPQDWVPLLMDNQSPLSILQASMSAIDSKPSQGETDSTMQTCENVPLGVQIRIMYGLIGTISNPQSKILGASIGFFPLQDIGLACSSVTCFQNNKVLHLRVLSTVKFVDVTSPAVAKFAEPPAIHIRLPPDFFYPFMATEDSSSVSMHSNHLILILPSLYFMYLNFV